MILREHIHPYIQRALYRKIDGLNRIRVGDINATNFFQVGDLDILEPRDASNPVDQMLSRACWAKVSTAIFDEEFNYDKAESRFQAAKKQSLKIGGEEPEREEPNDIMVTLSSYRDDDGNLVNQPLAFNKNPYTSSKNYMFRGHAGITSISSEYKNFFIKESVVNFICPDPEAFQDINDIFLKHGQYVAIEFGWGIEPDKTMSGLNSTKLRELNENIRVRNLKGSGNYQCLVGLVSNFTFNQRTDGGYEGSFTVISAGKNILYTGIPTGNLEDNVTFAQRKAIAADGTDEQKQDWELLRKSFATFNAAIENLDSVVDEHIGDNIENVELHFTGAQSAGAEREFRRRLDEAKKEDVAGQDPGLYQPVFGAYQPLTGTNVEVFLEETKGKTKGSVLSFYKDGAMRIDSNSMVKRGGELNGVKRFVSWGWFEDYILNSFFSYELKTGIKLNEVRSTFASKPIDSDEDGGQKKQKFEFESNKCQTSFSLSSLGLDSIILPGKTILPRLIDLNTLDQEENFLNTYEVVSEFTKEQIAAREVVVVNGVAFKFKKKKMDDKLANNINNLTTMFRIFDTKFKSFEPQDYEKPNDNGAYVAGFLLRNKGTHGRIRNMVFNIEYIQEAFANVSSLEVGLRKFWAKVSGDYGGYWDFGIANDEVNSGKIGIIDLHYNPQPDLPDMLENRSKRKDFINHQKKKDGEILTDGTDKIFTFPLYSKDSIVKDFSLSVNLSPEAVTLAVYGSHSDRDIGGDSNKGLSEPAIRAYSLLLNKNFKFRVGDRKGTKAFGASSIISGIKTPLQENGKGYASTIERPEDMATRDFVKPLRKGEGIHFMGINDIKDDTKKILTDLLEKESTEEQHDTNIFYDFNVEAPNANNVHRQKYFVYNVKSGILKDSFKQFMLSSINKSENPRNESNYTKLKPIIPLDLDMTIDGIGGLKPGDLFRVDYLPQPYKEFCYFMIFNVSQEITTAGWSTKIKAKAIADFERLRSPEGVDYQIKDGDDPPENKKPNDNIVLREFLDFSILDEAQRIKERNQQLTNKMFYSPDFGGNTIFDLGGTSPIPEGTQTNNTTNINDVSGST